jgi:KUP system potassium uptake protein
MHAKSDKWSLAGLLVAVGIIYGDIGTSPLYVMQAIFDGEHKELITKATVYGALSCIFWTLTLQTTFKYVLLILRADNKGEGGIFALFALVKRHKKWLTIPAIIGGATLLADGIITPPISVMSAVEGLTKPFPNIPVVPIVLVILTVLFLAQIMGTSFIGKAFGPIMVVWFLMLGISGVAWISHDFTIFQAISPIYGVELLLMHPGGFWILGAVFLCTTGAEALYSDLGHCGRANIRISWILVKICLLLQYFGQGAWLLSHEGQNLDGRKPIFEMMPSWFLLPSIGIATLAAIIASQALISGSFTLIAEGIRLNFWPKVRLIYPSEQKGQIYVPSLNFLLWAGCCAVVLYFGSSSAMEAAYGLAITLTMLMTTTLFTYYLIFKKYPKWKIIIFILLFVVIEVSFLVANLRKFSHGGYVSLIMALVIIAIMAVWHYAHQIKQRFTEFESLTDNIDKLCIMSQDESMSKYASHLVYMTSADRTTDIERKIMYSIFQKRPKRADIYWFLHVDVVDEPYTMEYKVHTLAPNDVIRINFRLGFRVEQRINLFFKKVLLEMAEKGEVEIKSKYDSLKEEDIIGDFRFVVMEKFLSYENSLPFLDRLTMEVYFLIKQYINSESQWFGLDSSNVKVEKVPLIIKAPGKINLKRVY